MKHSDRYSNLDPDFQWPLSLGETCCITFKFVVQIQETQYILTFSLYAKKFFANINSLNIEFQHIFFTGCEIVMALFLL